MRRTASTFVMGLLVLAPAFGADNVLTPEEKQAGWRLLFDGKTLNGWMCDTGQPSRKPVEDGCINPHGAGSYMLVYDKYYGDFVLKLDFKIAAGTNSGVFVRTFPLTAREGHDVGENGLEVAIDDTSTADFHDTGAIYDLVKPSMNAMKPAGEWNALMITCNRNLITVDLNGETVSTMNLDEFIERGIRPDGSAHKFTNTAWRTHSRKGYIGLQDHGGDAWFKNIKLLPMNDDARDRVDVIIK